MLPFAEGARSRLAADANQTFMITNQFHNEAQVLNRTFETNVKPLADQALQFEQSCRSDLFPSAITPVQLDARTAACQWTLAAGPLFRTKCDATQAGLQHLEQVYSQEHVAQQDLLTAAYNLQ